MRTPCNCSVLMKDVNEMCSRCKIDYLEWLLGINRKELMCLAKIATAEEKFKKLKELQSSKQLKPKQSESRPRLKLVS